MVDRLPESFEEECEARSREAYGAFRAALGHRP